MSLRVTMTWVPATDPTALDVACAWADRLGPDADTGTGAGGVCVWTTRPVDRPDHPAADRCCWHDLGLAPRLDRHAAHRRPDLPWSPWGTKSGPNAQFFRLLDAVAHFHPEEWILFAEPDTVPVGPDAARHLRAAIAAHPDAWVVGAHPHAEVAPTVADDLRHHLNGAALYRVGDPAFADFRTGVWIPSLLARVRDDPEYAYDCVTDPAQWSLLPDHLADAWRSEAPRFVATAGIVNASTLTLTPDRVRTTLTEPSLMAALDHEGVRPWLLHAKGPILDAARTAPPGTYEHVWGDLVGPLADAARTADEVVVVLHAPKTAGTTLVGALETSPRWVTARLHPTQTERDTCSCGARAACRYQHDREAVRSLDPEAVRGRRFAVVVGHESWAAVRWIVDRLAEHAVVVDHALTGVRPTRDRLVSAFTDYWTQVAALDSPDAPTDPHHLATFAGYGEQADLYRRPDGSIDGPAWFTAFTATTGGVEFFLDQIFTNPAEITAATGPGRLRLVPTGRIDATVTDLVGHPVPRRRVSTVADDPAVVAAIAAAADVLDATSRRDADHEAVIARVLADPGFHS